MEIVTHSLVQIANVHIFPIISFIIFFTFFLLMGYTVYKAPKSYVEEMAKLPLDDNGESLTEDEEDLNA